MRWKLLQFVPCYYVPSSKPERDAMITAAVLEHNFTAVTHNMMDFANTGINLVNPWQI